MWGLLALAELACEQSSFHVPHQVLAVLLPADAESLSIEDENAAGCLRIHKMYAIQIPMQGTHDGCVLDSIFRVSHAAVCAAIEDVAIVKRRGTFSAPAFHSESVLAGMASSSPTTEPNRVPGAAEGALFFMDELREG